MADARVNDIREAAPPSSIFRSPSPGQYRRAGIGTCRSTVDSTPGSSGNCRRRSQYPHHRHRHTRRRGEGQSHPTAADRPLNFHLGLLASGLACPGSMGSCLISSSAGPAKSGCALRSADHAFSGPASGSGGNAAADHSGRTDRTGAIDCRDAPSDKLSVRTFP